MFEMCCIFAKRLSLPLVEYHNFCCTKGKCYMRIFPNKIQKEKKKEFLELKQGNMTVFEECIPTEVAMGKRFEVGLNEDIKLSVRIL
ncbi:26S proteasome non-ATPase regulatory subunit 1-like protein A-like [Gossypium australe]|uniref:26S proteasome non-ATPase regulatory subunit 1-like protein A-like n=1 Tax=Gossypium australe TaxID=47621 RepID=A0A5B6X428_9ROSI|nr:26S proteasome non-ATPase regulatory subunit 1-like protein A-like [Gossypium australe]